MIRTRAGRSSQLPQAVHVGFAGADGAAEGHLPVKVGMVHPHRGGQVGAGIAECQRSPAVESSRVTRPRVTAERLFRQHPAGQPVEQAGRGIPQSCHGLRRSVHCCSWMGDPFRYLQLFGMGAERHPLQPDPQRLPVDGGDHLAGHERPVSRAHARVVAGQGSAVADPAAASKIFSPWRWFFIRTASVSPGAVKRQS